MERLFFFAEKGRQAQAAGSGKKIPASWKCGAEREIKSRRELSVTGGSGGATMRRWWGWESEEIRLKTSFVIPVSVH